MQGTMKKAVITGVQQAALVDMAIPQPVDDWALVEMKVIPMCTEYKAWLHGPGDRGRTEGATINALGHEGVGQVVEVAQPCGVEVGDRVVLMGVGPCGRCSYCRAGWFLQCSTPSPKAHIPGRSVAANAPEPTGAYAQYRLGAAWLLPKVPDDLSWEHASLAWCGLGPTFGAVQTLGLSALDTVLITGAGPVGQGGVINAKYRGATVIVSEPEPWRAERAKMLGADHVVDPRDEDVLAQVLALSGGGLGVTCAIDCAGVPASQRLCIDATRPHGTVVFVAESSTPLPITVSPDMIRKSLTIRGQWHYSLNDFDQMVRVLRATGDKLDILISHRFGLSQVQEALALSATHETGKILLDPWA